MISDMASRIEDELNLLRTRFPDLGFQESGQWVLFPRYTLPPSIWDRDEVAVSFQIPPGYPAQKPYSFFVSPRIELSAGGEVKNRTDSNDPPFEGNWMKYSWDLPKWQATANLANGSNLLNFALTFHNRLAEGA